MTSEQPPGSRPNPHERPLWFKLLIINGLAIGISILAAIPVPTEHLGGFFIIAAVVCLLVGGAGLTVSDPLAGAGRHGNHIPRMRPEDVQCVNRMKTDDMRSGLRTFLLYTSVCCHSRAGWTTDEYWRIDS